MRCQCGRPTNERGKVCCSMCWLGYAGHSPLCRKRAAGQLASQGNARNEALDALRCGALDAIRRYASELEDLVRDLTMGDEPCALDSDGQCTSHLWFETDPPCPNGRAQSLLAVRMCGHKRTVMRHSGGWLHVDVPHLSRCDRAEG